MQHPLQATLPEWAVAVEEERRGVPVDVIVVDPDVVYSLYLERLGLLGEVDQFKLEVCRMSINGDLFDCALMAGVQQITVHYVKRPAWALARHDYDSEDARWAAALKKSGLDPATAPPARLQGLLADLVRGAFRSYWKQVPPLVDRTAAIAAFEAAWDAWVAGGRAGPEPKTFKHPKIIGACQSYARA